MSALPVEGQVWQNVSKDHRGLRVRVVKCSNQTVAYRILKGHTHKAGTIRISLKLFLLQFRKVS